jgi:DNA polymerase I-like protein with 3'-5' exonuclease and polymerase domains/uracil-DNA glycosylase
MASIKVENYGPQPAKVLLVGEAPGSEEETHLDEFGKLSPRPFVGKSGQELTRMLNEAGILRSEIRVANVCKFRPPGNKMDLWWPKKKKDRIKGVHHELDGEYFDSRVIDGLAELREEVLATKANVIVPVGNLSLWALTRNTGITKWRSSLLRGNPQFGVPDSTKIIPTIHPAAVLRNWEYRYLVVHDFRRVARWQAFEGYPSVRENFLVRPSLQCIRDTLTSLLRRLRDGEQVALAVDIETHKRHLACIGIAWSRYDAICIPFFSANTPNGFWSLEDESEIVLLLRAVLTHQNARCVGQNWQYDYQYIAKYWGFEVNLTLDIMSEHHVQFPGLPKGLDFQSSLYRDIHIYWKDEGKEMGKGSEDTWWTYNCRDCVATFEIAEVLLSARKQRGLRCTIYGTPHDIQQRLSIPVARSSARGIKIDHDTRARIAFMLQEDVASNQRWIEDVLGHPLNVRSTPQMRKLFYDELKQEKILDRKTKSPTLGADVLEVYGKRDVLLRPICGAINHQRSLANALTVCLQPLDKDGRFRCQYSIPGTETYRFASSSDPFGFGTNGQNITSGERAEIDWPLPNIRKCFIPDSGFILGEFDLPQADARVVAWEAEDKSLIDHFLNPNSPNLHYVNGEIIFGKVPKKGTLNYYLAKQGVHLTHYGGTANVLARTLGITVREAELFQKRYFSVRVGIPKWHRRIELQLATKRYVENAYGYRRFYFDRIDNLLKEALAWIPQSTVAIATNLGILNISDDAALTRARVEFLLQVHDSSIFQWPIFINNWVKPHLHRHLTVTVPYSEPLVFQAGIKVSTKSWGDCEEVEWKEAA